VLGLVCCIFWGLGEFLVIRVGHEFSESYEDFFHGEVSVPLGYSLEFGDIDISVLVHTGKVDFGDEGDSGRFVWVFITAIDF